jgi:CrcB protein
MQMIFAIGLGGALGAISRHFMTRWIANILGSSFPYGTMSVNVIGSFLMGMLITLLADRFSMSQELRGFVVVGLLGGFTTFSAFSMETALLIERNTWGLAALYITGSVLLSVVGLFIGIWAGRTLA